MRFAYSRHHLSIEPEIKHWIARSQTGDQRVYALLDGSMFDKSEIERLAKASLLFRPALPGSAFENLQSQGPLLCAIENADPKQLAILLRRTDGIPALSLISTAKSFELLSEVLLWLAIVQTEDEQRLHCRFADTRTLPLLLNCLSPGQIGRLATGIDEWLWIARCGGIESRRFSDQVGHDSFGKEVLQLDAGQFDFMLSAAEADMVFQMLDEKMSDLVPDSPPHEIHTRISALLDTARSYGIADLPELFQYTVVALSTRDDFDRHPAIRETWSRLKNEGLSFSMLAEQWPETFWATFAPADEASAVNPE